MSEHDHHAHHVPAPISDAIWREVAADADPWDFAKRVDVLREALPEGARWLDLGCGTGRFLAEVPNGIGVEVSEVAAERASERGVEVRVGDGATIPLEHASVDLVWCSEVLQHTPDALGLVQEARRVLRPGGRLVVTVPGTPWYRRLRASAFDPLNAQLRFYTRASLAELLRAGGFEPHVIGTTWLVGEGVRS